LNGVKPPVWRRLLAPGSISLKKLHDILQIAMGWTNSHLHQFAVGRQFYGTPDPDFGDNTKNEAGVREIEISNQDPAGGCQADRRAH
jgi:hypothetical protein